MSTNPERSRLARVSALLRKAKAAESAGRVTEAVALLREVVGLDPHDRGTLHRLGDLLRVRLNRYREAATVYAREARLHEHEGFHARAIAVWRLVLRSDPGRLEAYERIGALSIQMGHLADARQHYDRSARELREAGLVREAAIVRAHLAALVDEPPGPAREGASEASAAAATPVGDAEAGAAADATADATALDLASDRMQNGRLFHHYGLHEQARQQLEELLASLPDHLDARQLLVEVCRALGDDAAAARHLRVATRLLVRAGRAALAEHPAEEGPAPEDWGLEVEPADPLADLMGEIHEDVLRLVLRLESREEGR